jgi:outer membrane protein assembly factor BamB
MLVVPDDSGSSAVRVRITTPPDVAELPPVVEASKSVLLPGSSSLVTGPAKPRVLWRARVTVGDAWHVVGIAADGTVYVYDQERNALDAIRDGKEQWAYNPPGPVDFTPLEFAADGRLWAGNYCFNSRGEGGRVTNKSLLRDRPSVRAGAAPHQETYACSDGKVYASDSRGKKIWTVDLDGNCGSQSPTAAPEPGNIYAASDAHTLYAMSREGRLLWTVKQACKKSDVSVNPRRSDELIVACRDQPLYSLRDGKPLWISNLAASEGWRWSEPMFDSSGNIYLGAEGPSAKTELTALNKSGKQVWKVTGGTFSMPEPIGFDAQGRLYVTVSEQIVSLSQ